MNLEELRTRYQKMAAEGERLQAMAPLHRTLQMVLDDLERVDGEAEIGPPETVTTAQAAKYLGVTVETVADRCRDGFYPGAFKTGVDGGGNWVIPARQVYQHGQGPVKRANRVQLV